MSTKKNPAAVALGQLGGRAGKGKAKARTSEQARAAALTRWRKAKNKAQLHGLRDRKPDSKQRGVL